MGLRERLRRLEREAERAEVPTRDRYLAATRRETARRLRGVYERLARVPGKGGPSIPHQGRDRGLLADDTPERAESDRRLGRDEGEDTDEVELNSYAAGIPGPLPRREGPGDKAGPLAIAGFP